MYIYTRVHICNRIYKTLSIFGSKLIGILIRSSIFVFVCSTSCSSFKHIKARRHGYHHRISQRVLEALCLRFTLTLDVAAKSSFVASVFGLRVVEFIYLSAIKWLPTPNSAPVFPRVCRWNFVNVQTWKHKYPIPIFLVRIVLCFFPNLLLLLVLVSFFYPPSAAFIIS